MAYKFNNDAYIDTTTAQPSTTVLTVFAWATQNNGTANMRIFGHHVAAGGWDIRSDGSMAFGAQVDDGASGVVLTSGDTSWYGWHHVGFTLAGTGATDFQLWLDGKLQSVGAGRTVANADMMRIGADGNGTSKWVGNIAEVAVWANAVLDPDEIVALSLGASPLAVRSSALYGYWPLDGDLIDLARNVGATGHDGSFGSGVASPVKFQLQPQLILAGAYFIDVVDGIRAPFISSATVLYQPITPVDLTGIGFIAATTTLYAFTVQVEVDRRPPFIAANTIVVSPKLAQPIVNVTVPVISGTATEGLVLTASTGTWTGTPPLTYAYQWRLCDSGGASCADITGATNPSYIVQGADVGGTLRVVVTASDH